MLKRVAGWRALQGGTFTILQDNTAFQVGDCRSKSHELIWSGVHFCSYSAKDRGATDVLEKLIQAFPDGLEQSRAAFLQQISAPSGLADSMLDMQTVEQDGATTVRTCELSQANSEVKVQATSCV